MVSKKITFLVCPPLPLDERERDSPGPWRMCGKLFWWCDMVMQEAQVGRRCNDNASRSTQTLTPSEAWRKVGLEAVKSSAELSEPQSAKCSKGDVIRLE